MADMGMGNFVETSPTMADLMAKKGMDDRLFRVGEKVKVKGSKFIIEKLSLHEMTLRLLPDDDHQLIPQKK